MITIYNTLTQEKEPLQPINPGEIRMYVCGNTVYDYSHIGHARTMVAFDAIRRYLIYRGFKVTYVRNITDIDDKIIQRANENQEAFSELAARFITAEQEDIKALNILPADVAPRATSHIGEIISMIQQLLKRGYAYVGKNGDVFYDVSRFESYGQLGKKNLEKLRAGARVEVSDAKLDPLDFVLWKQAKPGEPSWDSPWGEGRPGWHIECSAMSTYCLGEHIDIHAGGADLTFPHHENEIAQTEGATGKKFVNVWMHAGFLQINKEKMSKSLGNFFTIREVLEEHDAEVLRFFLLSSHYRSQLNYSVDSLDLAKEGLSRFYLALRNVPETELVESEEFAEIIQRFHQAMDDDFNTPEALAVMFEVAKEVNIAKESENKVLILQFSALLRKLGRILGLLERPAEDFLRADLSMDVADIEMLIVERNLARANKDWARSDEIRDQLAEQGILLEDKAGETSWRSSGKKTRGC